MARIIGLADTEILSAESLSMHAADEIDGEFPPHGFLRYLKQLATAGKADLVFFYCFTWGGETEIEY